MIDARLQLLIAVCEYGTVTAAAQALHRSPSGVSKQLKELAAELDVALLERHGRRVRLTAAGNRLVEHARTMNAQWEMALSDTAAAARQLSGPLPMGGFPTAVSTLVAPTVRALRSRHPGLDPTAHEIYSHDVLRRLESGAIDVGIYVAGEDARVDRELVAVADLIDDPIDLLVPVGHRFAELDSVTMVDAEGEEWISGRRHQDSYTELLAATRAVGYSPRVVHFAQELTAVTALVGQGLGIAAVPRIAITVPHPGAVRVPLSGRNVPQRKIVVCTRRGAEENPRIVAATDELRRTVAGLAAPG
ncbi:LysR family transcriptional regulator [Pseudonocardia sp. NPDC049635]|uniref:LysR family transcriptional regulator n=1 Tax=Pseudonocardia sp. NPDC049635 TaxID=3155506 RepID=UPI0033CF8A3E